MLEFLLKKPINISLITTSVIMVYISVIGIIIFYDLNLNFV